MIWNFKKISYKYLRYSFFASDDWFTALEKLSSLDRYEFKYYLAEVLDQDAKVRAESTSEMYEIEFLGNRVPSWKLLSNL